MKLINEVIANRHRDTPMWQEEKGERKEEVDKKQKEENGREKNGKNKENESEEV